MSIKISFKKTIALNLIKNYVLFCDENFSVNNLRKYLSISETSYISDLIKTSDLKKKLLVFKINSKKTIYIIPIKKKPFVI